MPSKTTAAIRYHAPWERHPSIHIDVGGVPGARLDPPLVARTISLVDARSEEGAVAFASDGLVFVYAPTRVKRLGDIDSERAVYDAELGALVARELDAEEVVVFDHTLRIDGPSERPPARHAHGDYTRESAIRRMREVLGDERSQTWERGSYAIVNAWRPLGPVARAPLAFARPSSVADTDWIDVDIIYPHRRGHVGGLLPSKAHEWVYLPEMNRDQIALFRVFDSEGRSPVAHSAVDIDGTAPDAPTRRSLESRMLVRFA